MTMQTEMQRDLAPRKLVADVRDAGARLKVLEARAKAREARQDMDEISGLKAVNERASQRVADLKWLAAKHYLAGKQALEGDVALLKAGLQRVSERYEEWDAAACERFDLQLDEADDQLQVWSAQVAQKAEQAMKRCAALARLEETIALARACEVEASHERYSAKAQVALEKAAQQFDRAYDAAATRYEE